MEESITSGENIISPKEMKSYEAWKKNGRMKLSTVDLFALIGLFTLGLLLSIPFHGAGKQAYLVLAAIVTCLILARSVHILFGFVAIVIYLAAWFYIHNVVKKYHKAYELEQKAAPMAN